MMPGTIIWQEIATEVRRAIDAQLHELDERALRRASDQLLAHLPDKHLAFADTAHLLRHYQSQLQHELCADAQPRIVFATLEDELCELTRVVLVTVRETISVANAVLIGLVVRARGIAAFCAPTNQTTS